MNTNDYTNFRIRKETRRKLRIAASLNDESGIEMLDRLVSAELERVQKKAGATVVPATNESRVR